MSRDSNERAHGPYRHGQRWRVVYVGANGERKVVSFATFAEADGEVREAQRQAGGRTVDSAVTAYLDSTRDGVRESTLITNAYRLRAFLQDVSLPLAHLTPQVAKEWYGARVADTRTDTHRNELALVRRAAEWWVTQGWILDNPFAKVVPVGRRHRGKPQPRIDESRVLVKVALDEGTVEGLAVTTTFLLGLRASECTDRIVRDVDDMARILWIATSKTEAGRRQMVIPEMLRDRILTLCYRKSPLDRLWGDVDRHWLGYHVRRLCQKAGIPVVSPHGLRGLHATIAVAGMSADQVARSIGHTSADITRRHYLAPGSEAQSHSTSLIELVTRGPVGVPSAGSSEPIVLLTQQDDSCAKGDSNPHGVTH